jgi:hypothetical protein
VAAEVAQVAEVAEVAEPVAPELAHREAQAQLVVRAVARAWDPEARGRSAVRCRVLRAQTFQVIQVSAR